MGVKGREKTNPTSSSSTSFIFFYLFIFFIFLSPSSQNVCRTFQHHPSLPPCSWFLESRCAVGQARCWWTQDLLLVPPAGSAPVECEDVCSAHGALAQHLHLLPEEPPPSTREGQGEEPLPQPEGSDWLQTAPASDWSEVSPSSELAEFKMTQALFILLSAC